MKITRKDNLTDVVERLPKTPVATGNNGNDQKPKPQETVVNNNGEVITLGQKKS